MALPLVILCRKISNLSPATNIYISSPSAATKEDHSWAASKPENLTIKIWSEVRATCGFKLAGYVIMPDHVHLRIGETPGSTPAKTIQVFKQKVSRNMRGHGEGKQPPLNFLERDVEGWRFWQRRYYDFNAYSQTKVQETLCYMRANPVRAKLVQHPGELWSSWCYYFRQKGLLNMDVWT
jgi:putative transposase